MALGPRVEQQFVVEVQTPVTGAELPEVIARTSKELGIPTVKLEQLLSQRLSPITRPISRDNAEEIAEVLRDAGVQVAVRPIVGDPARTRSARWPQFPHRAWDGSAEEESERKWLGPGFVLEEEDFPMSGVRPRVWGRRLALLIALVALLVVLVVLQSGPVLGNGSEPELDPVVQYGVGLAAYREGRFVEARRAWGKIAADGHAQAQFMLGYLSETGLGEPWSGARAAGWYAAAAEQGHSKAQFRLGDLYARGMGVPRSEAAAAYWFGQAAEAGEPQGQYRFALTLMHGRGVPRDLELSLHWFARAAENGVEEAESYLDLFGLLQMP